MQNHRTRDAAPSAVQQQLFDFGLENSIIAERVSRFVFGGRHCRRAAVHPDCTAVEQERFAWPQCVHQLLRTRGSKANEINNCIGA